MAPSPFARVPRRLDGDAREVRWRKSSASGYSDCVQLARLGPTVLIGDTKHPDGPPIACTPGALVDFLDAVRAGHLLP